MIRAVAVAAVVLAACAPAPQEELEVSVGDTEAYARDVHRVLEPSCATLDCHGDRRRPLQLFAETGLRLRDDLRDSPITDEELRLNVRSLAGVDPDPQPVESSLILLEPLAVEAGGVHHVGGDVWPSTEDPSYRCVLAFLEDRSGSAEARAACVEAWEEVGLPPE